jgi:hypothetical protein
MNREYHKWRSSRLGREMELLVFGHAGLPVLVFPTSGGRFYEFEDRGMIAALAGKIDAGQLQLFCVDSVDARAGTTATCRRAGASRATCNTRPTCSTKCCRSSARKNPTRASSRSAAASAAITRSTSPCAIRTSSPAFSPCRRLRPHQLSRRLLRPGLLLQSAHALPAQPERSLVLRPLPPQHLRAGHWMGRPMPGPEPEPRPHPERERNPAPASTSGIAELPRLAHMAAHGAAISTPPAPGKWSAAEIVCHLADCDLVFGFRCARLSPKMGQPSSPSIRTSGLRITRGIPAAEALAAFSALRNWNLRHDSRRASRRRRPEP